MGLTENEIKKNAIKIEVTCGDDIGECLRNLVELKNQGKYNYYMEINGHKVYSVDVDYEKDFKRIVGVSEEELNAKIEAEAKRMREQERLLKEDAINNYEARIQNGKKYIHEAKHNEWENKVTQFSNALYNSAMDYIIKYLELLNDKENIKNVANDYLNELPCSTTDWYQMQILSNIALFSNNGIEFMKEVISLAKSKGMCVSGDKEYINELVKINTFINKGLNYEKAKSLANEKIYNFILTSFREITKITVLKSDNNMIGVDEEENIFIATIFNDNFFVGFHINSEKDTKNYILGEMNGKNITAYTAESDLLDFCEHNKVNGVMNIEMISSRKDIVKTDKKISEIVTSFDPKILARLYNQLAIDIRTMDNVLEDIEKRKTLS